MAGENYQTTVRSLYEPATQKAFEYSNNSKNTIHGKLNHAYTTSSSMRGNGTDRGDGDGTAGTEIPDP